MKRIKQSDGPVLPATIKTFCPRLGCRRDPEIDGRVAWITIKSMRKGGLVMYE